MYFCLNKLNKLNSTAKPAEKRLISFILQDPTLFLHMTIEAVAEASQVSYATVCRLCEKLNFSGIKELKKALLTDLKAIEQSGNSYIPEIKKFDISPNSSTAEICNDICDLSINIVQSCKYVFDSVSMETAISFLSKATSLLFIGLGTSAVSAQYAYTKLFRIGVPCSFSTDPVIFKMKASLMKKNDVLFVVSSSGRTKPIVECAKIAREKGAKIISICDYAISPLAKISNVNLLTTSRDAKKFSTEEFPLIIGQIVLIDTFYSCYYSRAHRITQHLFEITKDKIDEEEKLL